MIIRSDKLRESAKGQMCTLNIPGICNWNPETSVLAHLPSDSHGMALKSDDLFAVIACSCCHDAIDARGNNFVLGPEEKSFYMLTGLIKTQKIFYELGLISIEGDACTFS